MQFASRSIDSAVSNEDHPLQGVSGRLGLVIIAVLAAIYIANCFTPLRLTYDTIRYFNIKEWLEAGKPANDPAGKDFLPYGYTGLLMLLEKPGLATSFVIAFIHLLYLAGSLWFVKKIFDLGDKFRYLVILVLLNWLVMKFVITPLSEMQFIFFSTGALFFYDSFEKKKKILHLLAAILFCFAAMLTRTAGLMLLAAFVISFVIRHGKQLVRNKWTWIGIAVCAVAFVFLFNQFRIVQYANDHSKFFKPFFKAPLSFIANNLRFHLIDLAALSLNAPAPKISFATPGLINVVYIIAGALTLRWILALSFRKGNTVGLMIKVYLVCYMLLVFNWPFYEPRFWLPLLPLFIAIVLREQKMNGRYKFVLPVYRMAYILIGIAALGYYTYTSFNKKAFELKQDAGIWKNEYETHFFGRPVTDTSAVPRERILEIIKKYD